MFYSRFQACFALEQLSEFVSKLGALLADTTLLLTQLTALGEAMGVTLYDTTHHFLSVVVSFSLFLSRRLVPSMWCHVLCQMS